VVRHSPRFLATLLVATPARAAEFHAVITNFGSAPRASAHLDVSLDTRALAGGSFDVLFDVFRADGTHIAGFSVPVDANGFASSASAALPHRNLFQLAGGEPAIVRARTPGGGYGATATLQQRGRGSRLLVSVPKDRESDGTPVHVGRHFTVHVGDLRGVATASLVVANVSGSDIVADVFVGTEGSAGTGKYSNARIPNRNTWQVDLASDDENANIVVTTSAEVIVQLVIDDGRLNAVTVLPTAF
jgi:hypothetical protein